MSTVVSTGAPTRPQIALFIAGLVAIGTLSQSFRILLNTVAPDVMRDLGMSAAVYGVAVSAFFLSLVFAQVPLGIAFDRYGVRGPITVLTVLTVLGAIGQSLARTPGEMIAARLVVGLGCCGYFMAGAVLCGAWFAPAQFSTMLARVFALSGLGTLLAGTPLAVLAEWLGWRGAFGAMAGLAVATGILFWFTVHDTPPGMPRRRAPPGSFLDMLRGIGQILRLPRMPMLMAMHFAAYASMLAIMGAWSGPYLADVHGMDALSRGHVVTAMAIAQIIGVSVYGPLDRIFNTRKGVVIAGALLTLAPFLALVFIATPPAWLAVTLLVVLCFFAAYSVQIVAHGRAMYPPDLVGRGVTTLNIAQVSGSMALPLLAGAVISHFSQGGPRTDFVYRMGFGAVAAVLLLSVLCYLAVPDKRPRD
jgi:predicted MFS family arabinose efflux permease